jgi:hypothetical protein
MECLHPYALITILSSSMENNCPKFNSDIRSGVSKRRYGRELREG